MLNLSKNNRKNHKLIFHPSLEMEICNAKDVCGLKKYGTTSIVYRY